MKYILLSFINLIIIILLKFGSVEGVIGGNDGDIFKYSYQVSLQVNNKHICSGALLSKSHVLTAAQCFINGNEKFIDREYFIVGGMIVSKSGKNIAIAVRKIYIPREYKLNNPNPAFQRYYRSDADIAVLKLEKEIESKFYPINLPQSHISYGNTEPILSGFGTFPYYVTTDASSSSSTNSHNKELRYLLKNIETRIVLNVGCRVIYKTLIRDNHLCAVVMPHHEKSNAPLGTSDGDAGSPLVVNKFVIGVLVTAPNLNENHFPAIYTRVSSYTSFIQKAMNDENSSFIRVAAYKKKFVSSKKVLEEK